ncbi:MAG TPA: TolC family protein [Gemmataceae bacterium]|nr:TolC family protein [Gemmataceae bacterium]
MPFLAAQDRRRAAPWLGVLAAFTLGVAPAAAAPPPPSDKAFTLEAAVLWALRHNPDLAAVRQQHNIAAAAVVIARTYPFNPVAQSFVLGDNGPASSGVTNHVFNEHTMRLDLELRHQGQYRRQMAQAALSRTDWEIANQELLLAVRVARAFAAFVYRRDKLRLVDEGIRLQDETAAQVAKLVEQGRLPAAELLLARANAADARALRPPAYSLAVAAWHDLRRLLGIDQGTFEVDGVLEPPPLDLAGIDLEREALQQRPDHRALSLAVQEASARTRLEIANRFGNPSLGPAFEYNETRDYFIGMWAFYPIPVINTRKGEIMQRRAEQQRAVLALQANETTIRQDVAAALARLKNAADMVNAYRTEALPALLKAQEDMDKLFSQGEAGADVVRVLDLRRRVLRARDQYLDALFEYAQARADLMAAVGDLALVLPPCEPEEPPATLPPPRPQQP